VAATLESYGLLWLATLLAAIVALPIAGHLRDVFGLRLTLAPAGTASMAALIVANNVREAAIPLLFAVLKVGPRRWLLIVGDVVVSASLAVNVALGGLALGAYGPGLLHYLPQWPLEWGGLALALASWRRARRGQRDPCELALLAIGAAMLLCLAALLETYAVPQA
jgi:MFS family permease